MTEAAAPTPKKKGKAKKIILIGVGLAVLAGGGAGAAVFAGLIGPNQGPAAPDLPKLVLREGISEAEASSNTCSTCSSSARTRPGVLCAITACDMRLSSTAGSRPGTAPSVLR